MDLRVIEVAVPLRQSFTTANGTVEERRMILVGLSDGGVTG